MCDVRVNLHVLEATRRSTERRETGAPCIRRAKECKEDDD
jgi:hypothetical protein